LIPEFFIGESNMKAMFDTVSLGSLQLKNRLIRSATFEIGGAKDGKTTQFLEEVYRDLAKGGVGLVITGMMGVSPNACLSSGMTKIYGGGFAAGFKKLAEVVHGCGGKIVVQLGHCGAQSKELDEGSHAFAPSDTEPPDSGAKAMTTEEIHSLAKAYGAAARKCRDAGADGVQIHAAHGYLLSRFLSPIFNRRTDEYGGSIAGRARFLFEVYEEIRKCVGRNYPVLVKINYSDIAEGGISEADVLWYCKELDRRGIDAIEVSAGIGTDKASGSIQGGRADEAFNAGYALRLSHEINAAVISVGGYRSPEKINEVLNAGNIAAVSLCRPLIREPGLPGRWQSGDLTRGACVSCGKCFKSPRHGCFLLLQSI
jgi:2,4-dienoyl-CoA reductase-like NADH-dependent reductase (Old Yellow Enzyme family)